MFFPSFFFVFPSRKYLIKIIVNNCQNVRNKKIRRNKSCRNGRIFVKTFQSKKIEWWNWKLSGNGIWLMEIHFYHTVFSAFILLDFLCENKCEKDRRELASLSCTCLYPIYNKENGGILWVVYGTLQKTL